MKTTDINNMLTFDIFSRGHIEHLVLLARSRRSERFSVDKIYKELIIEHVSIPEEDVFAFLYALIDFSPSILLEIKQKYNSQIELKALLVGIQNGHILKKHMLQMLAKERPFWFINYNSIYDAPPPIRNSSVIYVYGPTEQSRVAEAKKMIRNMDETY